MKREIYIVRLNPMNEVTSERVHFTSEREAIKEQKRRNAEEAELAAAAYGRSKYGLPIGQSLWFLHNYPK